MDLDRNTLLIIDEDQRILTLPFYELFLFADEMADDSIPEGIAERTV